MPDGGLAVFPFADRLILALDFPSAAATFAFLDRLENSRPRWVKVGLELYLSAGSGIVTALKERGHSVFLDLKLHDIPNTVAGAVRALGPLAPDMLTLHASGGGPMLAAAAEAAGGLPVPPRLLAVTVLTSMDQGQLGAIGIPAPIPDQVLRLALLARDSGVHGLVASAREAAMLHSALPEAHIVNPGIRAAGGVLGDQQRVMTAGGRPLRRGEPARDRPPHHASFGSRPGDLGYSCRDRAGAHPHPGVEKPGASAGLVEQSRNDLLRNSHAGAWIDSAEAALRAPRFASPATRPATAVIASPRSP